MPPPSPCIGRVKVGKAASPLEKEIVPGQCATLTTSGDIRLTKATQTEKEGWTKDEFYYDNTDDNRTAKYRNLV